MLQITINNKPYKLGQILPDKITSVDIQIRGPLQFIQIPKQQLPIIKRWFNDLITTASCEYITLNNIFYKVNELNAFSKEELKDNK